MIFCSKNERGTPAWKLVSSGRKTVTRRTKPMKVGKNFAAQPNRGIKAVCRCIVIACEADEEWQARHGRLAFEEEARKEGFITWEGLWTWIKNQYGEPLPQLYRIEFKRVKK